MRSRSNNIPLFRDIVEAKFMNGERKLLYKTSYADEDYKQCDILKVKKLSLLCVVATQNRVVF